MVAGLDDRRLFACDLLDCVAKVFLMVEVDVGDHSHTEIKRVGGVEPAPEPDFTNQPVDPRSQVSERHRRQHFELSGLAHVYSDPVEGRHQSLEYLDEFSLSDGTAVEL